MIVVADRGADERFFPHQSECVGDIARRAAEFFLHAVDLEANIKHVNFIREDMIGEVSGKIHNPVVGH